MRRGVNTVETGQEHGQMQMSINNKVISLKFRHSPAAQRSCPSLLMPLQYEHLLYPNSCTITRWMLIL